ncbi:MAG: carotenoid 1,2-hydratase [Steroidobacteraceae bacterium]
MPLTTAGFAAQVPADGYHWWYIDALSSDGRHGLTLIGFVGSVFSPYYAWARQRGTTDPTDHCAINVALYGRGGKRWAMTERGRASVNRTPERLVVGPSRLEWHGQTLVATLDEWTFPLPSRLRGTVTLTPLLPPGAARTLDPAGRHHWRAIAPRARVEVDLTSPSLSWSGEGYHDENWGNEPLEAGFTGWHWSRLHRRHGPTEVCFDARARDGAQTRFCMQFPSGTGVMTEDLTAESLPDSRWGIARRFVGSGGSAPFGPIRIVEDTPFYARSMGAADGGQVVQESLDLDRFRSAWVRRLLPFRMPRRNGT